MRWLFVFEGGAGAILPVMPLAQAVRSAGHEVFAAAHAEAVPILLNAGLPALAAPWKSPRDYRVMREGQLVPLSDDLDERATILGIIGARIAADSYHDLLGPMRTWRPDIIVGGPLAYAAPLLSAELDVPYVAVEFGMAEPENWHTATLAELRGLGFTDLPTPVSCLVLCPESIRPASGDAAKSMRYLQAEQMRYVLYAPATPVEPWMYTSPDRPRVWVSAGSRVSTDYALDYLTGLIDAAAELEVELLIAAPDDVAARVGPLSARARVGWLPFDVLAPTCDLAVHHGGGSTMLGCVASAVPQVIIPFMPEAGIYAGPLKDYGAARVIAAGDGLVSACREVLAEPAYRQAAARLRAEMAAAPSPLAMVSRLEDLAASTLRLQ